MKKLKLTGIKEVAQDYIVLNVNMEFEPIYGWLQGLFSFHLNRTAHIKIFHSVFHVIKWKNYIFKNFVFVAWAEEKWFMTEGEGFMEL